MRDRDQRGEACQYAGCARPARFAVEDTWGPLEAGEPEPTRKEMCGMHMHAMERRGWTVAGKLRKDGR